MSEWSRWFGLTCPQNDVPRDSSCVHYCPCQSASRYADLLGVAVCALLPTWLSVGRWSAPVDQSGYRMLHGAEEGHAEGLASRRFLRGDPATVGCSPFMFCASWWHSHVMTQNSIPSSWRVAPHPRTRLTVVVEFFCRSQFGQNKHRFYCQFLCRSTVVIWSQDSAVGIATDYELDDRGVRVRVPAR
jgi:hypothetical protein